MRFINALLLALLILSPVCALDTLETAVPFYSSDFSIFSDSTLLGNDSDNDSIRDDIEQAIYTRIPDDALPRSAALFYAKVSQMQFLSYVNNPRITFEEFGWETTLMWEAITLYRKVGAEKHIPMALLVEWKENTPERYRVNRHIDEIFNGQILPHPDHWKYRDAARKEFQHLYEQEKER